MSKLADALEMIALKLPVTNTDGVVDVAGKLELVSERSNIYECRVRIGTRIESTKGLSAAEMETVQKVMCSNIHHYVFGEFVEMLRPIATEMILSGNIDCARKLGYIIHEMCGRN